MSLREKKTNASMNPETAMAASTRRFLPDNGLPIIKSNGLK